MNFKCIVGTFTCKNRLVKLTSGRQFLESKQTYFDPNFTTGTHMDVVVPVREKTLVRFAILSHSWICVCECESVSINVCLCVRESVCVCMCRFVCVCVRVSECESVSIYVCL